MWGKVPQTREGWVLLGIGVILLALVVMAANRTPGPPDVELRLGHNELELAHGGYRLVWVTEAHPGEDAFFEDFRISVRGPGLDRPVNEVRFPGILPVDQSSGLMYFEVADFSIVTGGVYEIEIEAVAPVPAGHPALYER